MRSDDGCDYDYYFFFTSGTADNKDLWMCLGGEFAVDNVCDTEACELHELVEGVPEDLEELVVDSGGFHLSQKLHLFLFFVFFLVKNLNNENANNFFFHLNTFFFNF